MTELGEGQHMLAEYRNCVEGTDLGAFAAVRAPVLIYFGYRDADRFTTTELRFKE